MADTGKLIKPALDKARTARDRLRAPAQQRAAQDMRTAITAEVDRQLAARDSAGAEDLRFSMATLIGGRAGADRTISEARYRSLGEQICALTGERNVDWQLAQAYLSLLDAETRGLGRIAGWTYNILGKLVVPPLLSPPAGPILEIGTLYGLFSPALVRSFRRLGEFRPLTVIDPLVGDQLQGGKEIAVDASRTPVIEDVVRRNFAEFGLGQDDFRVIRGYSTDDDVKAAAGDRTYAVVVIDGDHYEEGVEKDLWWVETILAPGGIAVMDDFGDKRWPGVEAATRKYLAGGGEMQLLGTAWTSGYLRMPS